MSRKYGWIVDVDHLYGDLGGDKSDVGLWGPYGLDPDIVKQLQDSTKGKKWSSKR